MAAPRIRRLRSGEICAQVLADELTIQVIADHVQVFIEAPIKGHPIHRKSVSKIASSIVAVTSAALGFLDPSGGFQSKGVPTVVAKVCFLAVMVCFCFGLGLLMLSEVASHPPISVSMARKLMLAVLVLVQLAVAMNTTMLLVAAA